jgi:ABC-type oligopeptide transport system substrate-binding subunit
MHLVTAGDWTTLQRLYSTLVESGTGRAVRPALAESWDQSSDGRVWTFTLRSGQKWSDGSPMLPKEVVASFERLLSGTPHSEFSSFVEKVALSNGEKIRFQLKKAPENFLISLSFADLSVVHPSASLGKKYSWDAPSSGAYRVSAYTDSEMILERNQSYWEKLPRPLQKVQVRKGAGNAEDVKTLLQEDWDACQLSPGAADTNAVEQLKKKYSVHVGRPDFLMALDWSRKKSKLGKFSAQFRSSALKRIYRNFWKGLPDHPLRGVGLRPEGTLGALNRKEFDQILDSLPVGSSPSDPKSLVVLIRHMFRDLDGVERLLKSIEQAGFRVIRKYGSDEEVAALRESGDYDMSIVYLGASETDPDSAWRIYNESVFAVPAATSAELSHAQLESDRLKRSEIYRGFERKLILEGLLVPIRYETTYIVTSKRLVLDPQVANDWGLQPFKLQLAE